MSFINFAPQYMRKQDGVIGLIQRKIIRNRKNQKNFLVKGAAYHCFCFLVVNILFDTLLHRLFFTMPQCSLALVFLSSDGDDFQIIAHCTGIRLSSSRISKERIYFIHKFGYVLRRPLSIPAP